MNFPINIEQWRLISGYDNYEVSSHGRVRNNTNGYIMKLNEQNGYKHICLRNGESKHTHTVHRLVGFAFLNKNDEQTEVDHIDHNRGNNMVNNLRWVTKSENGRNRSIGTNNKSGTLGVRFNKDMWEASWYDENMKNKTKGFSVKKYGDAEAKQLAINYRREMAIANGYINV